MWFCIDIIDLLIYRLLCLVFERELTVKIFFFSWESNSGLFMTSFHRPVRNLLMFLAHCRFPRISLTLWEGDEVWKKKKKKKNYQQHTGVFGVVSVFDLKLTSPASVEPCAAVGPEMNAQYLNLAYLVLSLHPVGSPCQHKPTQEGRVTKHKWKLNEAFLLTLGMEEKRQLLPLLIYNILFFKNQ